MNEPPTRRRAPKARPALERTPLNDGPVRGGDEVAALVRALGQVEGTKAMRKLRRAAAAFEADRLADARREVAPLVELVPHVPEVRELMGLVLYRQGRYREAAKQLEAFRELANSTEQNPVLADCYRAEKRWADVEALWDELAAVSPRADLVNEGRIVQAGALADQGRIDDAVRALEKGWKRPSRPRDHHLRRAYALADLYERSGDLPRARALFVWIAGHDADFVDVDRRLRALR